MILDGLECYPVRIPMAVRFRRVDHRDVVLVRGPAGWGEFSPFPEYPPEVAARWLEAALEAAREPWPEPVRRFVPVNVTVPAVEPERAARIVAVSECRTAKVKVAEAGQDFEEDVARVAAVREVLGTDGKLRIDANGAWSVDEAVGCLEVLAEFDLEYVEQPCARPEEIAELRRRTTVPVAVDEDIRTADDPTDAVRRTVADVVVLKVQPLGGVRKVLEVAAVAPMPVVISSALETSIGLAAGIAAAAALAELPFACGLATASLLATDVVGDPLLPSGGMIEVRRPHPDPERLSELRPPADVADAVMARLHAAVAALERR